IHNLDREQRKMTAACARRYPAVWEEIEALTQNPGIIAFLFDTLIDIEPLGSSDDDLRRLATRKGGDEAQAAAAKIDEEFDPYAEFPPEDPSSLPTRARSLRRAIHARSTEG